MEQKDILRKEPYIEEMNALEIVIPDDFEAMTKSRFNGNMNIQMPSTPPSFNSEDNHKAKLREYKKMKEARRREEDRELDYLFTKESKKFLLGLNGYTWCSQFRTGIEILAEIPNYIILIIYFNSKDSSVLRYFCLIYLIKHTVLLFDYLFTMCKGGLFFADIFFSLNNILFWVR